MHENYVRKRERKLPFKMVLRKADHGGLQIPEIRWGQGELKESYSTERSAADVFKP